jgi:predicted nucleic acid-binding Zn ribbon protein
MTTTKEPTQPCGYCRKQITDDEAVVGDDNVFCSEECLQLSKL